jgi:hypothetical protein
MIRHSFSQRARKAQVTEYRDQVRGCQGAANGHKKAQKAQKQIIFCAFCASLWQHVLEGES